MSIISIEEVTERFPHFRVAFVLADATRHCARALAAPHARNRRGGGRMPPEMGRDGAGGDSGSRRLARGIQGLRRQTHELPLFRRAAHQAGARRAPLPKINALVDLYNMVSLQTGLCLGCDDFDKTSGALVFRFAKAGDSFVDMGAEAGEDPNDPPKEGEVVYADGRHVLCRRWNWRQDARTASSLTTRRAVHDRAVERRRRGRGCGRPARRADRSGMRGEMPDRSAGPTTAKGGNLIARRAWRPRCRHRAKHFNGFRSPDRAFWFSVDAPAARIVRSIRSSRGQGQLR